MDKILFKPRGFVKQFLNGALFWEGSNIAVNTSAEIQMQCLMLGGAAGISSIIFGNTGVSVEGGTPLVNPLMRSVSTVIGGAVSPIGQTTDTASYISQDANGYNSIGTFQTIYTPSAPFSYDTLGLQNSYGSLFAITSFPLVSILALQSVCVQWTIYLSGDQ
jgi:hypothetical protein